MESVPATKQALLDAAAEVLTEKGMHEARIIDVTRRAGVAAGTFYTYFDSKDALFLAVVEAIRRQETATLPQPRFTDAAGARGWLHEVVRLQVERYVTGAATWRMINSAALGNVVLAQALSDQHDPLSRTLESEFRLWAEAGWIDPGVDCTVVVQALVALTEQTVQQWCAGADRPDLERAVAVVAEAWTAILRMREDGESR